MKLVNETDYRVREMKNLLTATHNFLAKSEGRMSQWKRVEFTVRYTRTAVFSGHAYLNGTRSILRLRRPCGRKGREWNLPPSHPLSGMLPGRRPMDGAKARDLVRLGYHEMLHLYGYFHSNMARKFPLEEETIVICDAADFGAWDHLPTY